MVTFDGATKMCAAILGLETWWCVFLAPFARIY